ncbi:efflux transporter periplasmic adaptor subunit [Meridianimarinicoccus roseus]|uniref:Efflux transporter periplasmic adaptor subunit n=1 Tax=Meridianimarinicoccus roseus TaxID=2072018 RepID=A0A2V2LEV6_9RHOB|nr:HlyD family efflux transporter periplasmic adaptor subunit [Meridianimarinicoccus roseus]PWR01727.1 efflux transporter periplasmic adaptor subunit [Meridianimarinicoccus roseus]
MHFLRSALVGVLLAALSFGALGWAGMAVWSALSTAMGDAPPDRARREVVLAVRAVTVTPGRAVPVIDAFGTLRSTRTLDLRAASGGQVVALADPFRDGVRVARGDLLVSVDPAEAKAALATARADLSEAEATLRDAERGVTLARDDLTVTQEQADLRAQALSRQNDLAARGVGSASAVETAALAAAQARQAVVGRRQALAEAEARLDQSRTARDRAEIALGEARRLLEDTSLTAQFDGVLSDVAAVRGGRVAPGDLLARLVDPAALEVAFRLSTAQFARLTARDGAPLADRALTVRLDLGSDGDVLETPGTGLRESPVVGEGESGRALFAGLERPAGFRPGDIVTVRIAEPPLSGVARLPASAVGSDGRVLVIGPEERLREAWVQIVRRQDNTVLVRAPGLEGARIVADLGPALGAGLKVRIIEEAASPASASAPVSAQQDALIDLTPARRAALIAAVQADASLPAQDRDRMLALLEGGAVPLGIVQRIEQSRGG